MDDDWGYPHGLETPPWYEWVWNWTCLWRNAGENFSHDSAFLTRQKHMTWVWTWKRRENTIASHHNIMFTAETANWRGYPTHFWTHFIPSPARRTQQCVVDRGNSLCRRINWPLCRTPWAIWGNWCPSALALLLLAVWLGITQTIPSWKSLLFPWLFVYRSSVITLNVDP